MNNDNELLHYIYLERITELNKLKERTNIKAEIQAMIVDKQITDKYKILHILSELYKKNHLPIKPYITDLLIFGYTIDENPLTYINID